MSSELRRAEARSIRRSRSPSGPLQAVWSRLRLHCVETTRIPPASSGIQYQPRRLNDAVTRKRATATAAVTGAGDRNHSPVAIVAPVSARAQDGMGTFR